MHMHIEIDMGVETRIDVPGAARGRAATPDGMPSSGLGQAARSMAGQGSGSPPVVVKGIRGR